MNVLNSALVAFGVALTILVFAFGVRRLLGLSLAPLRTLLAGLIAFFSAQPIVGAIGGPSVGSGAPVLPGLWFVLLGVVIALLVGMIFLVVSEALVPSGSLPGPVYLVRALRRQAGRTRRYAQITRILVRRGLLPYQRGGRRSELASAEGRARLARSLRLALEDGGVTFVKLGQVLSTRRDLLPPEFITELSRLQDDAPQVPWPQIEATLRAELGAGVDEVFASFEREPLAAASIAQVHRATLAGGRPVVVKVRRPGVDSVARQDLDIVLRLALRLQRSTSWGRAVGAVTLAHGFADALDEELDLRIEARNLTAVAAAAARHAGGHDGGPVRVPTPEPSLCGQQVLVMDFLDGRPLASVSAPPATRAALAASLLDTLLRQVLLDGTFHADPHPGNVLLLADGTLGLLDFGSVGRIDAGLRAALQRLLLALDRGDPAALADALLDVVERPEDLDEARLERTLGRFAARHMAAGVTPDVRMFTDLFRIVAEHGLAIPPEIAAVFRSLATMEGTLTQLDPGFDIVAEARQFASGQLAEHLGPEELRRTALDEVASLLPMLRRLPRRVDRIGQALETGRLSVNVRLLADPSDRRFVTGLLHQVLLTFLAAAAGIMAVLMIGLPGGPSVTRQVSLYAFFGYCLLVVAAILAVRVLVLVFRPDRAAPLSR
ncbi:MAG TPA: AarF/UbiB family protein [Streptosporangiaceae bacterium]|nr:AarF/UbiB family protein [Streptosporangiaceae bacterium]